MKHRKYLKREQYIYYGMAILICVFIISGMCTSLQKEDENKVPPQTKQPVQEAEKEVPDKAIDNPNIRVLLMTNGYRNEVHPNVVLSSEAGMTVTYGEQTETIANAESLTFAPDDARFQQGNIRIQGNGGDIVISSMERSYGTPTYKGVIELRATAEGIAIINELQVETYLCKVVPSEMPSSYELEALKVQAVCARSYAYRQMEGYGYPEYEAHVNDSTDFQVYGNSTEQEPSNQAIAETAGQVVRFNGKVVTTYYYSTSCGRTTTMEAWGTAGNEENAYLQSASVAGESGDYEKELPWYRWEAVIPVQTLSNLVGLNTGKDVGTLQSVEVTKTGPGDVALQITATGDKGSVEVDTENKIRRALGGSGYRITKQDGTVIDSSKLLPSAFFTITKSGDDFVINGGGFGHGIGMSQNGANEMAKKGKNHTEILSLFFPGTTVD